MLHLFTQSNEQPEPSGDEQLVVNLKQALVAWGNRYGFDINEWDKEIDERVRYVEEFETAQAEWLETAEYLRSLQADMTASAVRERLAEGL